MPNKAKGRKRAARNGAASRRRSDVVRELEGVSWYVGCPHSGKTTAASVHARWFREKFGVPVVVVDSEETEDFRGLDHCAPRELPELVWKAKQSVAVKPGSVADVDAVAEAVRAGKDVVLLVDEASLWLSNRRCSEALLRVLRTTQHCRVRVLLTTQHFSGDIPQAALACAPDLYLFRTTSPRALDVLSRHFSIDAEQARTLEKHHYLAQRTSF